jgi:glycosyltransferase involved in cell wall biosynthesis
MVKPLVTIVIPTYNRSLLLKRAVQSVLNQTYSNLEVLIVDDKSTDKTEEVARELEKKDDRVRYIRQAKNQGAPAARNRGIKEAKGKYIGLLDDDDEYLKDKIELQVEKFKNNPRLGLVYGGFRVIREAGEKKPVDKQAKQKGDVSRKLLNRCFIGSPTVLVKREAFEKVGGFDENLQSCQDWDMWYRISKEYPFDYIDRVVAKYYLHDSEQITTNWAKKVQGVTRIFDKQKKDLEKYPKIYLRRLKNLVKFSAADGRRGKAIIYQLGVIRREPTKKINWKILLLLLFNFKRYQKRARMA